ncbi:anhydro-N-acetylmuramic acid kinase [Promicromonospora aerolata]|uniref:Anhydro-N-acetylmuramic acid kinase n=1 Tax=Promicromonospora aerolata TaxID=195749 RepID=A0ABW4V991_9MICO
MKVLGLISGTSHDGIDSAVVDFAPDGDGLVAHVVSHGSVPYPAELRARLVAALPPASTTLAEVAELDTLTGQAFARAAEAALADAGPVDLVVSHGQTVYHWTRGTQVLGTLQIGQPAWIAEAVGTPVLSDVRVRDVVAGGQGAPFASTIDALVLADRAGRPAALNLGGISNVTVVGADGVRAWDIGPANALIDAVVLDQGLHPAGYDADGALAARGTVDDALLAELLREPYYALRPPKSTGKELFHLDHVRSALTRAGSTAEGADLVATLTELTVRTVADVLRGESLTELFVSGGGVHNPVLMAGLAAALPGVAVRATDELGLGVDEKEAVLMALLGWLSWHGVPATVPSATGATGSRLLGTLTPGAGPLRLPEPRPAPRFLRIDGETRARGAGAA